jgi:cell wall-associated NlpC family hydrolase
MARHQSSPMLDPTTPAALKRSSWTLSLLTLLGTAAVVFAFWISARQIQTASRRVAALNDQVADLNHKIDSDRGTLKTLDSTIVARSGQLDSLTALADKPPRINPSRLGKATPDSTRVALAKPSSKRDSTLALALSLKDRNIPFLWGGKSPSQGFDSSGFVAYVLGQQSLLPHPERYWSGAIREHFAVGAPTEAEKLQPGDLVFYSAGYCAFYLGDRKIIGMLGGGIQVADLNWGPEIQAYGRVDYGSS